MAKAALAGAEEEAEALAPTGAAESLGAAAPPVRVITAASLFDGHDAAINIMRRILQAQGAEVIHLGHDRSVEEIAEAAVEEDAEAAAVSSYQGGHMEFFRYLVQRLRERGAGHVRVYGGGGGTIVPAEIEALHAAGVARIFSPADGRKLGLEGMIGLILAECRAARAAQPPQVEPAQLSPENPLAVARMITRLRSSSARWPRAAQTARSLPPPTTGCWCCARRVSICCWWKRPGRGRRIRKSPTWPICRCS